MYSRPIGVASHFNGVRSRKTAVEQAPAAKDVGDVSRSLLYLGPVPFLARRTSIKTSPSRIHSTVSSTITNCSFPIYCFSPILGLAREVISQLLSAPALFVPATVLASYHGPVEELPPSPFDVAQKVPSVSVAPPSRSARAQAEHGPRCSNYLPALIGIG
jgi:hypothetical protein